MANISFPYASFEAGVKDSWSKLRSDDRSGPEEAYRLMVSGYKSGFWHKAASLKRAAKIERALELLEQHDKKVVSKADRQLGRTE